MARAPRATLFKHDDFEFSTQIVLGSAYYRAADVGEVLATIDSIKDGDYGSWCEQWRATAERVEAIGAAAADGGHGLSARDAYLRASSYWWQVASYILGTEQGSADELRALWRRHRDCFERAAELTAGAWEKVAITYERTSLEGWFFRGAAAGEPAPLLILNNGSDGTVADMWIQGGAAGTERGYNCLAFDGPGQGQALYEQGVHFRPDWEAVIGPVVDYAVTRGDVDDGRIALLGVSQGGYWVPRAAAFEKRIAAAIADPGVIDVSAAMTEQLPGSMRKLLAEGKQEKFDSQIHLVERFSKSLRFTMKFRSFPYGTSSPFEMFKAAESYRLDAETAAQISCPLLVTSPEHEQFWPGQSQRLAELVGDDATVVEFTAAEGADAHCEPKAPGLRSQRVFDWLDSVLG
jgi:dienelactone hydrolase